MALGTRSDQGAARGPKMPIIAKLPQPGDDLLSSGPVKLSSLHPHRPLALVREEQDDSSRFDYLDEFYDYEDVLDSDIEIMDASVLHRPRPKKVVKVPVLPQRSEKRASTILTNVMQEIKNMDEKMIKKEDCMSDVPESDPHEQYLSSEEDASLSDDYEGSLMDFEQSEGDEVRGRQSSRSSRRKSQEDTARVVSFMMVGKPQIVNILTNSPTSSIPTSRQSMNLDVLATMETTVTEPKPQKTTAHRPPPLTLYPASRRLSAASTSSYIPPSANSVLSPDTLPMRHPNTSTSNLSTYSQAPTPRFPSRKSSRMGLSSLTSIITGGNSSSRKLTSSTPIQAANPTPITASSNHSFLNSDPFAHNHHHNSNNNQIHTQEATYNLPPSPTATPTTPKTPNSLALWKKGIARSLSKSRKPSKPKLYNAHAASSSTLSLASTSTTHTTQVRSSTSHGTQSSSSFASLSSRGKRHSTATMLSNSTVESLALSSQTSQNVSSGQSASTTSLARITSNPEPATPKYGTFTVTPKPEVQPSSNSSTNMGPPPTRAQMAIKRSETMPVVPTAKDLEPLRSPRDSAPPHLGGRYEEAMRRMDERQQSEKAQGRRESVAVDANAPAASAKSVKDWRKERRSFAAVALGLTRKKSVRKL